MDDILSQGCTNFRTILDRISLLVKSRDGYRLAKNHAFWAAIRRMEPKLDIGWNIFESFFLIALVTI